MMFDLVEDFTYMEHSKTYFKIIWVALGSLAMKLIRSQFI